MAQVSRFVATRGASKMLAGPAARERRRLGDAADAKKRLDARANG